MAMVEGGVSVLLLLLLLMLRRLTARAIMHRQRMRLVCHCGLEVRVQAATMAGRQQETIDEGAISDEEKGLSKCYTAQYIGCARAPARRPCNTCCCCGSD